MKRWIALAALAALPAWGQDFSKVEIKTEKLNDTTYMLVGAGGNIGLSVGDDAVFVIDDQYAPLAPKIVAAIAAITPKPVKFMVNTHWHGDHTGGNEAFGKAGAIIVAHDNVRKRMASEQVIEFFKSTVPPSPRAALPLITFSTDTTIVHFVKGDVIHMGDCFFNGMYPFIDTSSGGTIDGVVAAADRALALAGDRTRVIPGHGPLATKADLRAYRDMLATVSQRIKQMLRDGKKLEEVTASGVTADFDEKWGKGFIKASKFAEMVAMNLIKNQ
jgi:cyclase